MRRLLLLPLAILLGGCPPPLPTPAIVREAPPERPVRASFEPRTSTCPEADSLFNPYSFRCSPAGFNRRVASVPPDRIGVRSIGGRLDSSPSILVRRDTAFLTDRAVPMDAVERIWLIDEPSGSVRAQAMGISVLTSVVFGALIGAAYPEAEVGVGRSTLRGVAGGAGLGLTFGFAAQSLAERRVQPVEVVGWTEPPRLINTLAPEAECPDDTASGPTRRWYRRACFTPAELTARAGADWVRIIDLHLRDGGHIRGEALALTSTEAVLDGQTVRLGDVDRIELRHPHSPLRPVRMAAKSALVGAAYGAILGAGSALASGDADVLWQVPAVFGAVGGAGGLTVGLLGPGDAARDVTYVPAPLREP